MFLLTRGPKKSWPVPVAPICHRPQAKICDPNRSRTTYSFMFQRVVHGKRFGEKNVVCPPWQLWALRQSDTEAATMKVLYWQPAAKLPASLQAIRDAHGV